MSRKPQAGIIVLAVLIAVGAGYFLGRITNPRTQSTATDPQHGASPQESAGETTIQPVEIIYDISQRDDHPPLYDKEAYSTWMLSRNLSRNLSNAPEDDFYIRWRWDCAQDLIKWNSIKESRVLESFLRTPREVFIREKNKSMAYAHRYLPIGYGATITDPWVVSIMTQTIHPRPEHRVLEIGTGSGYQAAILAQLSNFVFSIEIIEELARETNDLYVDMQAAYPEYANIRRKVGDGYYGWPEYAPFDRIIVTCSIDHVPPDLLKQLSPGGVMVIPVGPPAGQTLMKINKVLTEEGAIQYDRQNIMPVKFIPFTMKDGSNYSKSDGG